MQSYLPVIVMILLASTLPGQTSDRIVLQPEALCEVAGRVVTAAEGSPLKAARVALIPEQSRTDTEIYATNSDSDGNVKFKGIPAGRYRFFAVRSGFVEEMYPSNGAEEGAVLSLKTGQKIKDVLFRMTRAAVIAGRVTNEDGEPLVGVQITALQRPTDDEIEDEPRPSHKRDLRSVAGSKTDDLGEYRIFGLKPGEY